MQRRIQKLNEWSQPKARYFGVIAGVIIFGSWAITNLLLASVSQAQAKMSVITNAQLVTDWQRTVDMKLSNLDKLVLRTRTPQVPLDVASLSPGHKRLYDWSHEVEYLTSFYQDWTDLTKFADDTLTLSKATNPPRRISREIEAVETRIQQLYDAFTAARNASDSVSREVFGSGRAYVDVSSGDADRVADAMKAYRDRIRATSIEDEYIKLKNRMLAAQSELRKWASSTLRYLRVFSSIFLYVSLVLYAAGTALAIYGKWLETATAPNINEDVA